MRACGSEFELNVEELVDIWVVALQSGSGSGGWTDGGGDGGELALLPYVKLPLLPCPHPPILAEKSWHYAENEEEDKDGGVDGDENMV